MSDRVITGEVMELTLYKAVLRSAVRVNKRQIYHLQVVAFSTLYGVI